MRNRNIAEYQKPWIIGLWVLQENNTLELANKSTHTGYKHKPYNYNTVQCDSLVFDSVPNWN